MGDDILRVIVGSRLHGLHKPDADYDYRGIFMVPLGDILDPFTKVDETRWVEGATKDDTSYELRKFVREVVNGNPNFIEMLFATPVEASAPGVILQDSAKKFLDSERIFAAYKGYASNQLHKMELFTPDKRTPKFAVAYIRSLMNGIEVLRTGQITNPVPEFFFAGSIGIEARNLLMDIKFCPPEHFGSVRDTCVRLFSELQTELALAFYESPRFTPDRDYIRDFVMEAYGMLKELKQ